MPSTDEATHQGRGDVHGGPVRNEWVPLESPTEWRASLEGLRHGFWHTWESCNALYLTSRAPTYLYRVSTPGCRAVCPLSERTWDRHTDVVTPYGFSGFVGRGSLADASRHLGESARRRGYVCGYIVANPALHDLLDCPSEDVSRHVYIIDLWQTEPELFSRLSQNRKREVRAFESGTARVVRDRPSLKRFVLSRYHAFMREKGATSVYDFTKETLDYLLELDSVLILGAGTPAIEAVSIFGYTPFSAEYLFNLSVGERRRWSAALIWAAIKELKARGVPSLNLGGGVREADGVAAFKERFGARRVPLVTAKQIYRPDVFAELCQRVGVDPSARTGYFPPYRDPKFHTSGPDKIPGTSDRS
jgi:hypothetical protein